jgi:hypothetical protein
VSAKLFLYEVKDFMGTNLTIPGIQLHMATGEPFGILTKPFGEFIGLKNAAYIDINNFPNATQLLEMGIAKDTGSTKHSGFCEYPLWEFDEEFLRGIGEEKYQKYSDRFEHYMNTFCCQI